MAAHTFGGRLASFLPFKIVQLISTASEAIYLQFGIFLPYMLILHSLMERSTFQEAMSKLLTQPLGQFPKP